MMYTSATSASIPAASQERKALAGDWYRCHIWKESIKQHALPEWLCTF